MIRVLFVCMGNICRSPAAEAICNRMIEERGLSDQIECDSAGTISYHAGDRTDARMRRHLSERGYESHSRARAFCQPEDFERFDWILVADHTNFRDIQRLDSKGQYGEKIQRITDYCQAVSASEVPDPYYGGEAGFARVMDILEDACGQILDSLT